MDEIDDEMRDMNRSPIFELTTDAATVEWTGRGL